MCENVSFVCIEITLARCKNFASVQKSGAGIPKL